MAYTHSCGKRLGDSWWHCAACHESFSSLSGFDAHRVDGGCVINSVEDPYAAKPNEHWLDERGVWRMGKKMTAEEAEAAWGKRG